MENNSTVLLRRRGRPKTHASNAARQKAYRERAKTTRPPKTADQEAWNKYLVKLGLSMSAGQFAPYESRAVSLEPKSREPRKSSVDDSEETLSGVYRGTRLNKIHAGKGHAWARRKRFGSRGSALIYAGNSTDLALISDRIDSDTGRVTPSGHGPDE